jgi:ABC-type histidine transport system ATPase subunit
VGSAAVKAVEAGDPRLAGSIPVHLRHTRPPRSDAPFVRAHKLSAAVCARTKGEDPEPAHQKKRVAIASVLLTNPEVLLFDEPTASLDQRAQQWLIELIVELDAAGKTIVLATLDLETLDVLADRCVVFDEDDCLAGSDSHREVLTNRELLLSVNLIQERGHLHHPMLRIASAEAAP